MARKPDAQEQDRMIVRKLFEAMNGRPLQERTVKYLHGLERWVFDLGRALTDEQVQKVSEIIEEYEEQTPS